MKTEMEITLTEKWLIDELSHAGPEHLDEAYVAGYDRKAQFDPTADIEHLQRLGLSKESTVIDFGAGTGTFALAVAPHCRSVIAVEPSPVMQAHLHALREGAGLNNLSIAKSSFLTYEHAGEAVDYIFTRNALHHLPDFWKSLALCRMHTMLKPNGIMRVKDLIFDFEPHETPEKIVEWMSGAVENAAAGWTADELAEHVREEYSTFSWLFDLMLARAGYEILDRDYQRNAYGTYTCRAFSL